MLDFSVNEHKKPTDCTSNMHRPGQPTRPPASSSGGHFPTLPQGAVITPHSHHTLCEARIEPITLVAASQILVPGPKMPATPASYSIS